MDRFIIEGRKTLGGSVCISGAKNAALPVMAAALLTDEKTILHNVPVLKDTATMAKILTFMGAKVSFSGKDVEIDPSGIHTFTAPYELVSTMRGSVCLLGPLFAKHGQGKFSMPGGCVIGTRPIDLHIKGLKKLGIEITIEEGYVVGKTDRLIGSSIFLGGNFGSSVLATTNIMCAASIAEGETTIEFASCEPEVVCLANLLRSMGAAISGDGSHLIHIKGVRKLHGTEFSVIPDRIEAGTYLIAGAISNGDVRIEHCIPEHLFSLIDKIEEAGVSLSCTSDAIRVSPSRGWNAVDVVTLPYPGFPTDLQAQMMAFLTIASGMSTISEKVFPERFIHAGELNRLGANISLDGAKAVVKGVAKLRGAQVMASDLRASAALVLAGLAAEGETEISRIYHLDRGYEGFTDKLSALGAKIRRVGEK